MSTPKKPTWHHAGYPPLTGEVGEAAVNGKLVQYPLVVRDNIDKPVSGQTHGIIAFKLLKTPQQTPKGMVYGLFKLRGNHQSDSTAMSMAGDIIKQQDSLSKSLVVNVGSWNYITDDDRCAIENIQVETDKKKDNMHPQSLANRDKRLEDERIAKELREREEKLRKESDENKIMEEDDPTHVQYYTKKRVTLNKLLEVIAIHEGKLKEIKSKFVEVKKEIFGLDDKYPDYKEKWIDEYNAKRKKVGIHDYVPGQDEIDAYESPLPKEEPQLTEGKSSKQEA